MAEFRRPRRQFPFAGRADYRSYLDRLRGYGRYADDAMAIDRAALAAGMVQPCDTLGGIGPSITGLIAADVEKSRFYEPFLRNRPADVPPAEWTPMRAEAKSEIHDVIDAKNRALSVWFEKDYLPKCRPTGVRLHLPQGLQWYAWRVRMETTTEMTPDEVHALGLSEVKRIRAEMEAVAKKAGYADASAMIAAIRGRSGQPMRRRRRRCWPQPRVSAKIIDGKMPAYFVRLPRLSYGVKAIPAETAEGTTTAYYGPGSPAFGHFRHLLRQHLEARPAPALGAAGLGVA